ncbi:MAG TPA: hypothetical protein VGC95_01175 [Chitinophagaceae bacterium]
MPSYRLLRSNKETGPYTLPEILTLGLKPYDLIWVEGRSAAWRYPSEVTELKAYAPVVEEQPFDRFYKKPGESQEKRAASAVLPRIEQDQSTQQPNVVEGFSNRYQQQPANLVAQSSLPPAGKGSQEFLNPDIARQQQSLNPDITGTQHSPDPDLAGAQYSINSDIAGSGQSFKPATAGNEQPLTPASVANPQIPPPPATKKVFVEMPAAGTFQPAKQEKPDPYVNNAYREYLPKNEAVPPLPPRSAQRQPGAAVSQESPIDIREADHPLETKYSQSLDDIKEMYINTLVQRKTRNRKKEIIRKLRPALVPLVLVLAGIGIGYFITSRKSESQPPVVLDQSIQAKQAKADTNRLLPIPEDTTANVTSTTVPPVQQKQQQQTTPSTDAGQAAAIETHSRPQKETLPEKQAAVGQRSLAIQHPETQNRPAVQSKSVADDPNEPSFAKRNAKTAQTTALSEPVQKKNVEVDPQTGERRSVIRTNGDQPSESDHDNASALVKRPNNSKSSPASSGDDDRKNIREMVTVKSNNYLRGTFGGIRGLELTVYNHSGFLVDEVSVEVQIMKPSEQPLRTDIITVKNIGANGAVTVKVPDSQRGIRVDYRITNVESRQWQKSTAGL